MMLVVQTCRQFGKHSYMMSFCTAANDSLNLNTNLIISYEEPVIIYEKNSSFYP